MALPLVDIYQSIIGEGALLGRPATFIQLGNSQHTMTDERVWKAIKSLAPKPCLLTTTGVDAATFNMEPLIDLAHVAGYEIALDITGSGPYPWLRKVEWLTVSPHAPSTGDATNWKSVAQCLNLGQSVSLKLTIADAADYAWALNEVRPLFPTIDIYLQPTTYLRTTADLEALNRLAEQCVRDEWYEVTVFPRLAPRKGGHIAH